MAEHAPEADVTARLPLLLAEASDQKVALRDDLVWFVLDHRYQGSLKHSGVIIPVAHRETVFDLTEPEVALSD